jgi:hypothetical protein
MSLINDALKRARESQQKNPPHGAAPLSPVEPKERNFNWILPVLVILLIVAACFFIGLSLARRTVANIADTPDVLATQQVESASVTLLKAPTNTGAPAPPAADAPPMKVQGIMYDPVRPWAIVDGNTVYVGDRMGDFRVKEISKNTITLAGPGGTNEILRLSQ